MAYGEENSLDASPWYSAPQTLTLQGDEVHVWRAALDVSESQVRSLWSTLTVDERQRAERYVFQKDRTHFVVAQIGRASCRERV